MQGAFISTTQFFSLATRKLGSNMIKKIVKITIMRGKKVNSSLGGESVYVIGNAPPPPTKQ